MMGLAQELSALFLMTCKTDFRLGLNSQYRVIGLMNIVAINTGDAFLAVCGTRPMEAAFILMATQAAFILCSTVEVSSKRKPGGSCPLAITWALLGP